MSSTAPAPSDAASIQMDLSTFLRLFQMRGERVMWFLGAGASRSAGLKTAWDMIWDFKQKLYCSQRKVPPSAITDVSDPIVQAKLQRHFDGIEGFPALGAEDEYSAYFEATYPSPRDRRRYLDLMVAEAKPSFGHRALALLIREKLCRVLWTTNFDKLVEDSVASLFDSTGHLVVADLGDPHKLRPALAEGGRAVLGKLHGDFHSERLKNTGDELRTQDADMRDGFVEACRAGGLAIVGYSGRDASIVDAMRRALDGGAGFPAGLFWFKRAGETPFAGVADLLGTAAAMGVEARFVEVESFDELMSDLVRFLPATSEKVDALFGEDRPRLSKAPLRPARGGTPAIRTNALPVTSWPMSCRLVECEIGGAAEVQEVVESSGADIAASRTRAGVLAFGRDAEIRRAFAERGIKRLETYAISPNRLYHETGERSLVRDALGRALRRRPGVRIERQGRSMLAVPDPKMVGPGVFNGSYRAVDTVAGTVGGTAVGWSEACGLRLDWRLGRLWLLVEPRVILDTTDETPAEDLATAQDFVRERRALRRNKAANSLLDGWIKLLVGGETVVRLRAFDISDGADADFEIARVTGFSGRSRG